MLNSNKRRLIVDSDSDDDLVAVSSVKIRKVDNSTTLTDITNQFDLSTPMQNRIQYLCQNKDCQPKTNIRRRCLKIHDERNLATNGRPFVECYRLLDAKINLQIIQKQYPSARIYQIEQRSLNRDDTDIRFCAASIEYICERYIKNFDECGGMFTNVMEYFHGDERCPLVIDVDWYNPLDTPYKILFDAIDDVVDALIKFISLSMVCEGRWIKRDDVCVSQACTLNGRKASFHIKIPTLVFQSMNIEMREFVNYFITWLFDNRLDYDKIPDIFFQQTRGAVEFIKSYKGGDNDELWSDIKDRADQNLRDGDRLITSCAIDYGVYSRGRAWRMVGVCKPNKKDEAPRFMRPLRITSWWDSRLKFQFRRPDILDAILPDKRERSEWARVALMMLPSPGNVSVRVPLQIENQARNRGGDDDDNVDDDIVNYEWKWILDITEPPFAQEQIKGKGKGVVRNGNRLTNVEYVSSNYHGLSYTFDARTQYWRCLKKMELEALNHKYSSGYVCQNEYDELKALLEKDIERNIGDLNIIRADNEKIKSMLFSKQNITLDPCFQLTDTHGVVYSLGDINDKTVVFCPKHTEKHPSAYVDMRESDGRRFVRCSVCSPGGYSIFETQVDDLDLDDWEEIKKQLGDQCVQLINKPFLELGAVLRIDKDNEQHKGQNGSSGNDSIIDDNFEIDGDDDNHDHHHNNSSSSSSRSEQILREENDEEEEEEEDVVMGEACDIASGNQKSKIYIAISQMGSGKTTLLKKLALNPSRLMKLLGLNVMQQPSILSITPRERLSFYMSKLLGLSDYKDFKGAAEEFDEWLCTRDRLSICINSVRRLEKRKNLNIDLVILDEFATMVMSFLARHMQSIVKQTWNVLQDIITNARVVILLAADGTWQNIKTLLPNVDWKRPSDVAITVNSGGQGGIWDHQVYMSTCQKSMLEVLKDALIKGESVYVPTNQRRFARNLYQYALEELNLLEEQVIILDKSTSEQLWREILEDPLKRLGFDEYGQPIPGAVQVLLVIATPAFGVGFSVPLCFIRVIAFFFLYPPIPEICKQQLARFRGVRSKTIHVFWQSSSPSDYYQRSGGDFERLQQAVMAYDEEMATITEDLEEIPAGSLRQFAISQKVNTRRACKLGWWMIVKALQKITGKEPLLLDSWLYQHGLGPLRVLAEVTLEELKTLRQKDHLIDAVDLPTTRQKMMDLAGMRLYKQPLTPVEVECLDFYNHLPIPTGLLQISERKHSFINTLDNLLTIFNTIVNETSSVLLHRDMIQRNLSLGIAMVDHKERMFQRFQVLNLWASFMSPIIHDDSPYIVNHNNECGITVFKYFTGFWRQNGRGVCLIDFPFNERHTLTAIEAYHEKRKEFQAKDAYFESWFDDEAIDNFVDQRDIRSYSKIIRKGLRQFLGMGNVEVRKHTDSSIRIKIIDLKRLITLACVRRTAVSLKHALNLQPASFDEVVTYRANTCFGDLIPTPDELLVICGMV